ncbi:sensor histidine kinase [Vibrio salinus]|uniref:sensor histidine kinase n=1 Tax=Vibrio salinus TaxID=2899784 RepID=UPI001E49E681|nr:HAMP domain-containing sensor histidine kinase [Vibrio salinus]MCE0496191.1 HAMP domain-containing histidine kinase [Vibrio salinus]
MKIRKSMHIYLSCFVIFIGSVTVISFSTVAMNYFVSGLKIAFQYSMEMVARETTVPEHGSVNVVGFDVSADWNALPDIIKNTLKEPKGHLGVSKYFFRKTWYETPRLAAYAMRYERSDGKVIYVARSFFHWNEIDPKPPFLIRIVVYAVIGVFVFCLCVLFLFYKINKPVDRLISWAKQLNSKNLTEPVPDFQYREINRLADIIQSSLSSVQMTLQREKKFLSHASHELRTPISVVRSNTELLLKLQNKNGAHEKEKQVAERVLRAGVLMTELCETLLWLNRGEYKNVSQDQVELGCTIKQLVSELDYLLKDKSVSLSVDVMPGSLALTPTLVRIVVGNLIRNAFQHTYSGTVYIQQRHDWVLIRNENNEDIDEESSLGFGLGLELTKQIIKQYNWYYRVKETSGGRIAIIRFC